MHGNKRIRSEWVEGSVMDLKSRRKEERYGCMGIREPGGAGGKSVL